ncbi:MAG: hypothetical protein HC836_33090 [Richelia sp. RM2_1_2]|nr:hypothetical protein [Richelia sp. RM2_1_2]
MPRKEKAITEPSVEQTPTNVESLEVTKETPAAEGPQLTLADIKNAVNVIDYAANQGSFKGWEVIAQVMQVRQRLASFIEAATPKVEGEPVTTPQQEAANS